jgi:ubiquinone/menaquinone biosynthesis C-methylase UbiE
VRIDYQETGDDLLARIDIHRRFGSRDIDQWMLDLLRPERGIRILDVGCGAGKQCFAFDGFLDGEADITGGDVSAELLEKARQGNKERGGRIRFVELDFNKTFAMEHGQFDLATCCFAIYYAANPALTVGEIHRVLRDGGRLFTTGPMPENKRVFYEIIREATGRPIPPMPGSSRYGSEILRTLRDRFAGVEVHVFENPLVFDDATPFMTYTRASLSEDRRLWGSLFRGGDDFENVLSQIEAVAREKISREGKLVMTKVVGGFLAAK